MLNVYQCSPAYTIGWNETQSLLFSLEHLFWWLVSVWMDIILEGSGPDRCWCLCGSMVTLWISSVVRSQSTVMQKNKHFSRRFCLKPNSLRAHPPFSLLLHHMSHIFTTSQSVASAYQSSAVIFLWIDKHRKLPWRFCTHHTPTLSAGLRLVLRGWAFSMSRCECCRNETRLYCKALISGFIQSEAPAVFCVPVKLKFMHYRPSIMLYSLGNEQKNWEYDNKAYVFVGSDLTQFNAIVYIIMYYK